MNQLLGTTGAAIKLKCSPEWVRRLADEGVLPCERTDKGRRIFRESDIEEYARGQNLAKVRAAGGEGGQSDAG